MATDDGFRITFSTGKTIEPNNGIVGIDDFGGVHEGYDGGIPTPGDEKWSKDVLTAEECVELADVMLARWTAFRAKHENS